MRNVWLIAKREYLERVRTKSFRVMTVLIPVVMIGGLIGSGMAGGRRSSRLHIAVVAPEKYQQFALDMQARLQERVGLEAISPGNADTRKELNQEIGDHEIDGYLWVSDVGGAPRFVWTPGSAEGVRALPQLTQDVNAVLAHEGSASATQVALDGSQMMRRSNGAAATVSAVAMFFLMYFVIMLYGMNVARSIIEEKTSRVFEVMLATVKPEEMMAGKMIGVGSVGLTQVAIWMVAGLVLVSSGVITRMTGTPVEIPFGAAQIVYFVVFFVLGYLLYSSIAAALGAMTNSEQELQQLNMFLALPLASCMFLFAPVMTHPSGLFATAVSFIPFCTPLLMYMRIMVQTAPAMVPLWQIALSIVDMLVFIWVFLWIASRIYRVGILMYGKKPGMAEILRWLKYS